jgi:hypothetical protein
LDNNNSEINSCYHKVERLEDCDFGIIPVSIQVLMSSNKKKGVYKFINDCKQLGKNVLVFSGGDYGVSSNNINVYTIRLGGFHSKLNSNTFMMPPFINDPYRILNKDFSTLNKDDMPSIGFVGHSSGSISKYLKELLSHIKGFFKRVFRKDVTDHQSFYPSSVKRYHYLNILSKNKKLKCDFIFRGRYRAGIQNKKTASDTTLEFYRNMNRNLYTFCLRGTGNFSARFYETLAMGRIPVLVDTDCRLPFYKEIDWNKHCLIVSEKEVDSLGGKLIEYHSSHSEEELNKIQINNRFLWKEYLRKDSYFTKLVPKLKLI